MGTDRKTSLLRDRSEEARGQATPLDVDRTWLITTAIFRVDLLFTMSNNSAAAVGDRRGKFRCMDELKQRVELRPCSTFQIQFEFGGARRDRTDDLLLAKQALSQLSYGPDGTRTFGDVAQRTWWAWEDLNFRPHAYQSRALTS